MVLRPNTGLRQEFGPPWGLALAVGGHTAQHGKNAFQRWLDPRGVGCRFPLQFQPRSRIELIVKVSLDIELFDKELS